MSMSKSEDRQCSHCNKSSNITKCSICQAAWYCNADCQQLDWDSHKAGCIQGGCLQLIQAITESNADVVARLAKSKRVLNGKADYTFLRESPNAPDDEHTTLKKWTALHQCVRLSNTEMMKILLDLGANVEIKDADGETPVFVASSSKDPELVRLLLKAGANPNVKAKDGRSALMMATRDGYHQVVKYLLEAGADVFGARDMFGRTVLDLATLSARGQQLPIIDERWGVRGQPTRFGEGETMEEAQAKSELVYTLLSEHVDTLLSEHVARNRMGAHTSTT
jgi:ankyrin repeat protein